MKIQKRDGRLEQLSFDKVIYRLKKLCNDNSLGLLLSIDPDIIAQRVVSGIYDGVTSCELDEEAARIAISMTENPEYQKLASRIIISNMHKSTNKCFSEVMEKLYNNTDKMGNNAAILADDTIKIIRKHKDVINSKIDYSRDYIFDYFGYKTLERSYLQKILNKETGKMDIVERPQHLYMRVAVGIHKDNIESILKTYNLISQHFYTHATPTMYNAGTRLNQFSSCFLLGTDDSIEGIFKTITDCGKISKMAGGIGLHITNIRAKGSMIRGTNGPCDGIIPMIKVYNETAKYINQGSRRKGSFAIYLETWHSDILEFLDLKKNQGHEDLRARDLFYAMWVSDLFMKQVEKDGDWYLMCPDECPGLSDVYGDEFENLYWKYVEEKRYKRVVKAQEVWTKILDSQIETGTPYIGYKDAINKKCNQKNLGTIKSSNLCVAPETVILTSTGYFQIQNLENQSVEVWNGEEWSETIIRKTGENQSLLTVKMNNGNEIECTPYHKFYIEEIVENEYRIKQVRAHELESGMKIIDYYLPKVDNFSDDQKEKLYFINNIFIDSVVDNGRISDTYCFTEEKRGMGIFNGILTGQCLEISLFSDDKEYATCFTGDTQILTKQGYRRIDECDNQDVLSYFNNDIEFKEHQQFVNAKLIDNGIKDVYELECSGTKSIKATENHLFVVLDKRNNNTKINSYKWVKLKDLTKNDKIILPKTRVLPNYDIDIIKTYNQDCLAIGWMIGDGWQCKSKNLKRSIYGVCFGPNDVYARDTVIKTLVKLCDDSEFTKNGYNRKNESFYTDKNGVYSWASSKKNFIKYIKDEYGLNENTARFKCIPDKIKRSQPIEIASCLSGLFSADGNVYIKYSKENRIRFHVALSSASKYLLDDVQQMLKCFAIESRIVFGDVKNRTNKHGKLTIENNESILNFNKYINFMLCKEKQQQLECGVKMFKKRYVFREYTKIKSIKYIGQERVYDLNVPHTHNFIAEGFVVHNCNLASIALPKYVKYDSENKPYFDFEHLRQVSEYIITPMNDVIDNNYYPVPETKLSNLRHRPLGIGVQGLVDVYVKMRFPFESNEAKKLNKEIFETIYYGALQGSIKLSKKDGAYSSFPGSPFSEGKLQFDLAKEFDNIDLNDYISGRWDWDNLKQDLKTYGARNSMLLALMPTASTAQIMNNTEAFEPVDSCIFKRRVLSGEYIVINKYLVQDLLDLGLWSKELKDTIIANDGSIQNVNNIPDDLKAIYKTVWEISMKSVIEQCKDRGVFVDQMQSMNLFMANPNYKRLTSMHFYAWKCNLKSGMYYLRSKSSYQAGKFSIDADLEKSIREKKERGEALKKEEEEAVLACSRENPESCTMCSS